MADSIDIDVPDPPLGWEDQAPWKADTSAVAEEAKFDRLDEIQQAKRQAKKKIQVALGWCLPATIIFAFMLFWAGVTVYAIHVVTPWGWLTAEQQKELHTLLFSGALGAVVAQGARRYID